MKIINLSVFLFLIVGFTSVQVGLRNDEAVQSGKQLYSQNCAACHSQNLREVLTAPALGNVHLFRDKDWLISFTRNSQQMIASGDSLAVCIWQEWGPNVMTNFIALTDRQIKNIYKFIANESKLQGIGREEVKFTQQCEINTTLPNSIFYHGSTSYQYLLEVKSGQLANVDYLSAFDTQIDPIELTLDQPYEKLSIALIFDNRSLVIPFVEHEGKYRLLLSENKAKINFPMKEATKIVAYSDTEDFKFTIVDFKPKLVGNQLSISLDQRGKAQFLEKIKRL